MKIDWSSEGVISWDEFCTYMQLEYAEKEDSYLRSKEVSFHLPAKIQNPQHKNPILKITDTQDGTFIACSQVNMNVMYISGIIDNCYNWYKTYKVRTVWSISVDISGWNGDILGSKRGTQGNQICCGRFLKLNDILARF